MNNLHLIELNQYEKPLISEEANRDWVGIGENNDYYQCLIDAFMNSTTNRSVITGISQQIYGKGLNATDASKKPEQFAQMKGLFKDDDLQRISLDLKMLGEAALQVTYKGKKVDKVSHFPRETLRAEKMNQNGEIENYYYAPDWTKVDLSSELTKIPVFGTKKTGNEIFIIRRYVTGFYYYSPSDYSIAYSTLESEISDYLINDAQNSFSGTKVINFNSGIPSEEKMNQIKNQVMNKLSGGFGEKVIVAFNHNSEQKTTVDDIPLNNAPDHYKFLSEECSKKIMLTHRITSPLLIGLRDGSNGLGSNSDEIQNASRLFNNTTIRPYQDLIIKSLDKILEVNGIALNLYFKTLEPLDFMEIDVVKDKEVIEEETGVKDSTTELEIMASRPVLPELADETLNSIATDLIELGENESELLKKYNVIDEMEVDYKQEERLDKMLGLASTGRAYPKAKSSQDGTSKQESQEGVNFLVRYTYSPKKLSKNKKGEIVSRDFCKKMIEANKVYRKEDILRMSKKAVNTGFGEGGSDTYSIWLYKGGARCSHKWFRKTYQVKDGVKKEITTGQAKSKGFKPQVNEQKVSVAPKDMPNEGFVNKPKKKK